MIRRERQARRSSPWKPGAMLERWLLLSMFAVLLSATLGFSPAYLNAYSDVKQAVAVLAASLLGPALVVFVSHLSVLRLPIPAVAYAAGWALLIAGFVSGMPGVSNGFEAWRWLGFHAGVAACAMSAAVLACRSREFLSQVAWLAALLLLVTGLYGIMQWLRADPLQTMRLAGMRIELPAGYPGSTFGNANFAVQFTAPAILLTFGLLIRLLRSHGGVPRLWVAVPTVALVAGLVHLCLTLSRGGLLAVGVGLTVAALLLAGGDTVRVGSVRVRVWVLTCVLLTGAVAGAAVSGTVSRIVRDDGRSAGSTIAYRLDIWRAAWSMALDAWPRGVGPGQFDIHLPAFGSGLLGRHAGGDYAAERVNRAHNEYLDFLTEGGAPAAAAALLVGGAIVAVVARGWQRRDPLLAAGAAAIAAVAANAAVDYPLHNAASAILFAVVAGSLVARRLIPSSPLDWPSIPVPVARAVLTLTFVFVAGLATVTLLAASRFLVSQHIARLVQARREAGRPAEALMMLQAARRVVLDNRDVRALEVTVARQAGDTTAAEKAARAWATLEPWSTSAHNALGAALAELGQTTAALESFRAALRIAPTNHAAKVNAATVLYLNGRYCEAYELYKATEPIAPHLVEGVLRHYADAALECAVTTETLQLATRYVAAHPADAEMRQKFESAQRAGLLRSR